MGSIEKALDRVSLECRRRALQRRRATDPDPDRGDPIGEPSHPIAVGVHVGNRNRCLEHLRARQLGSHPNSSGGRPRYRPLALGGHRNRLPSGSARNHRIRTPPNLRTRFRCHAQGLGEFSATTLCRSAPTGPVESTCSQYQRRFKLTGQFWSLAGDEAFLALDTLHRNKRWCQLFPHDHG